MADTLMMRAGFAVTERPIGRGLGEKEASGSGRADHHRHIMPVTADSIGLLSACSTLRRPSYERR
jgi:hypothetical protein